jgi:putative transcriptional regulator
MQLRTGQILISEPFLPDPNFRRTVIFLAEYSELGAVGYVLNHKTDFAVNLLIKELDFVYNTVYQGGPVELESFHYFHTYANIANATHIKDSIYWGGDFDELIKGLKDGTFAEDNCMFFIGYSGWAAGQLEEEVAEGSWILTDLDDSLILNAPIEDKELWKEAIKSADGADSLLYNSPLEPNLN